jgi:hypothetical protein
LLGSPIWEKPKLPSLLRYRENPNYSGWRNMDVGKTQCPITAPFIGYSRNKLVFLEWQYRSFCMAIVSRDKLMKNFITATLKSF